MTAPDPSLEDQLLPSRENYDSLLKKPLMQTPEVLFGPPRVYNVTLGLERNKQPFLTVRVGVRTTFLKDAFMPWLQESVTYAGFAILISLLVAAFVANLALRPIAQISARLDALTQAGAETAGELEARLAQLGARPGVDRLSDHPHAYLIRLRYLQCRGDAPEELAALLAPAGRPSCLTQEEVEGLIEAPSACAVTLGFQIDEYLAELSGSLSEC